MHHHRTPRRTRSVASPGAPGHLAQRLLLLELLVDPPIEGERHSELATRLRLPITDIRAAAVVLASAGLAETPAGRLRASETAMAFDALWPICL